MEVFEQSAREAAVPSICSIRDFARRVRNATSFEIQSILKADCFTVAIFEEECGMPDTTAYDIQSSPQR